LFALGIWLAVLFGLVTMAITVVAAAHERDEISELNLDALTFVRLTFLGFFGVSLVQSLDSLDIRWWVVSLVAVSATMLVLLASQLAAKALSASKFGSSIATKTSGLVRSFDLLFTPLSLPRQEKPDEFEKELLESVDEFGETIVREVMVPRIDMATVKAEDKLEQAMKVFLTRGYSRLPVLGKNVDDVVGILYLKDVTRLLHENPKAIKNAACADHSRTALFVPESKPVDDLLRELQTRSTHIAVVVDEYGGVAGLVTMEDVIEEIVGDISDEYDREIAEFEELESGKLRVIAGFSLFDLGEKFDLELEDDDVDTVGGLLAKTLGRLPAKGDSVEVSGLTLTAERIEGRRKRLITVLVEASEALQAAKHTLRGDTE
jgi:CBS domain containing-hemolysin-like protein